MLMFALAGCLMTLQQPATPIAQTDDLAKSIAVLESAAKVFESVAQRVGPAVVSIEVKKKNKSKTKTSAETGTGSGVYLVIDDKITPVVVTNYHVVEGARANEIDCLLADNHLIHPNKVFGDKESDLAILQVEWPEPLPSGAGIVSQTKRAPVQPVRLADSSQVRVGQFVVAVGSPFGLTQSISHGIVSSTNRQFGTRTRMRDYLQTDTPINPGNSGGPLLNIRGELIGINNSISSPSGTASGVSFAIPSNTVRRVVIDLLKFGKVRRPYIGIDFAQEFTFEMARDLGLDAPRGAFVSAVLPNSPAERAGLKAKDVILEFAGKDVFDESSLINHVANSEIGSTIELTLIRQGSPIKVKLVLEQMPESIVKQYDDDENGPRGRPKDESRALDPVQKSDP